MGSISIILHIIIKKFSSSGAIIRTSLNPSWAIPSRDVHFLMGDWVKNQRWISIYEQRAQAEGDKRRTRRSGSHSLAATCVGIPKLMLVFPPSLLVRSSSSPSSSCPMKAFHLVIYICKTCNFCDTDFNVVHVNHGLSWPLSPYLREGRSRSQQDKNKITDLTSKLRLSLNNHSRLPDRSMSCSGVPWSRRKRRTESTRTVASSDVKSLGSVRSLLQVKTRACITPTRRCKMYN